MTSNAFWAMSPTKKTTEIIECNMTIAELEKMGIALSGDSDQIQEIGRLLPESQDLYNLLRIDQEQWEEDR